MNTNEASLGQSTVQTYSTTEKSAFERAVFALECAARWLDNGSDPAQAAEQIRLAIAQIKGCIADCDVKPDLADASKQASKPAPAVEQYSYASTQATNCARCGEHKHTPLRIDWMGGYVCLTCIDKQLEDAAPSVEQDERGAIYQVLDPIEGGWSDVPQSLYDATDGAFKRIVYTVPPAQTANTDDARLIDLFDVLMRQNIETSDESYLSLKCVGVPPTKVEFVAAVQCALTAAQSASGDQA
jgi:hypothetical protein